MKNYVSHWQVWIISCKIEPELLENISLRSPRSSWAIYILLVILKILWSTVCFNILLTLELFWSTLMTGADNLFIINGHYWGPSCSYYNISNLVYPVKIQQGKLFKTKSTTFLWARQGKRTDSYLACCWWCCCCCCQAVFPSLGLPWAEPLLWAWCWSWWSWWLPAASG